MISFKNYYEERTFIALDMFIERMEEEKGQKPNIIFERSLSAFTYKPGNDSIMEDIISFADENELTIILESQPSTYVKKLGFFLNKTNRDFRFPPNVWIRKCS